MISIELLKEFTVYRIKVSLDKMDKVKFVASKGDLSSPFFFFKIRCAKIIKF
jgi:hypothetical protein